MNRAELRTAIKDRLAIPSTGDGLITDTFINTSINDSLARVSAEKDWWWLASTATLNFDPVNGAANLPSDFMRANQLVINGAPVNQIIFEDYIDPLNKNVGYGWTIYGNQVRITPIPATTQPGTFYYFRSEPALSADGNSPLMPIAYHYVIVCYASYLCAARRQDESRASLYLQEYGNWLRTLSDDNRTSLKKRIQTDRNIGFSTWD